MHESVLFTIHTISRVCHHLDSLVHITYWVREIGSHIVYILKLSTKDLDTLTANKRLVLDAMLLESPYVTYLFL